MSLIQQAIREDKPFEAKEITSATVAEVIKETKAVSYALVVTKKGQEYLRLVRADAKFVSIKVKDSLGLTTTGDAKCRQLLSGQFVVYYGDTLEDGTVLDRPWLTFGKVPELVERKPLAEGTLSSLLKTVSKALSSVTA